MSTTIHTSPTIRRFSLTQLTALYTQHTAAELAALFGSTPKAWNEYMRRRGIKKQGAT